MKIYKIEIEGRTFRIREDDPRVADGTDPCRIAAEIVARREFGRRGVCATMRLDSHAADGSYYYCESFIGRLGSDGSVSGRNIWIREEVEHVETYPEQVQRFNAASGRRYSVGLHFLTFRRTSRGILVGFTIGKPEEIRELRRAVAMAGEPYYCK